MCATACGCPGTPYRPSATCCRRKPCIETRRAPSPKAPQQPHNAHKRIRLASTSVGYSRGTGPRSETSRPFHRTCAGNRRPGSGLHFPRQENISISHVRQRDTQFSGFPSQSAVTCHYPGQEHKRIAYESKVMNAKSKARHATFIGNVCQY